MEEQFDLLKVTQKNQAVVELKECNEFAGKFGLTLSDSDIQMLIEERFRALKSNGRVEFGNGILKKLVFEFCDSPYVMQDNFADTIQGLQEAFYYFKNESLDEYNDEELIDIMKDYFEHECQGSIEYLQESKLEDICRKKRYGNAWGEDGDFEDYD
jgi:hypothetical protein